MDDSRFDALAKSLSAQHSRRSVIGALAGAALAAFGFGTAADARRCRSAGNSCAANGDCCSGLCAAEGRARKICQCIPDPIDITCQNQCGAQTNNCGQSVFCGPCCALNGSGCGGNGDCCSGLCAAGVCRSANGAFCFSDGECASGHCCANVCLDASADPNNCGACGNVCRTGETCAAGVCDCGANPRCPVDQQCISGACAAGCGGFDCGTVCGRLAFCFAGPEESFCFTGASGIDCGQPCNRDADCGPGFICAGNIAGNGVDVLCGSSATGFCGYGLGSCPP